MARVIERRVPDRKLDTDAGSNRVQASDSLQGLCYQWFREWDLRGLATKHYLQLWRPAA
jgi:hypothetical protein